MTAKAKVFLVLALVCVLAAVAGIVGWVIYTGGPEKTLARAELAVRVNNFDKAIVLADKYIAHDPNDWRGYFIKGQALSRQGSYDDARSQLTKAGQLNPTQPTIFLAHAETYTLPASRVLSPSASKPSLEELEKVVADIAEGIKVLEAFEPRPTDKPAGIRVKEALGLAYRTLGVGHGRLERKIREQVRLAEAANNPLLARQRREEAEIADREAKDCRRKAIALLLEVVQEEPARDSSAEPLVRLCLTTGDEKSLEAARKAIFSVDPPAPMGSTMLAVSDLTGPADRTGSQYAARVSKAADQLEGLIKAYPDNTLIRLKRAELAMELGDLETADRHVANLLEGDPRNSMARLLKARVRMAQGRYREAESILYMLTTEFPKAIAPHYWYALAGDATGRTELAKAQMREVTQIDPGDSAEALRYIASAHKFYAMRLLSSSPQWALDDAREAYRIDPNDPAAMLLVVEAAHRLDRPELAAKTLEDASAKPRVSPTMLVAVADGWKLIDKPDKVEQALDQASRCQPANFAERLAVAQALIRTGRGSQADKLLDDAIAQDPNDPQAHFVMALRFEDTGRGLQAREHYRKAVALNTRMPRYRIALANSLLRTGELEKALEALEPVVAVSKQAQERASLIRALLGLPEPKQTGAGDQAVLTDHAKAVAMLNAGELDQCIQICQDKLEQDPSSVEYLTLLAKALTLKNEPDKSINAWMRLVAAQPNELPLYRSLAAALMLRSGNKAKPKEVYDKIAALPGARKDLANSAIGALCRQMGRHADAAQFFRSVADDSDAEEALRYRSHLFEAGCLAKAGQVDEALKILDQLLADEVETKTTLSNKAHLLVSLKRTEEAKPLLDRLVKLGKQERDRDLLVWVASSYSDAGDVDKALAVCDIVEAMRPNQAELWVLRATILERFDRFEEAGKAYEKALELNPTRWATYVSLAQNFDARQQPAMALETLKRFKGLGQTGNLVMLYTEATFFEKWGLPAPAGDRIRKITDEEIKQASPALRLQLARMMARLDMKDRAVTVLERIPEYSREYQPATMLRADLAETTDAKLGIIRKLLARRPDSDALLSHEMKVLMDAGMHQEAVKAFFARAGRRSTTPVPAVAAAGALASAVRSDDLKSALTIAETMADTTGLAQWNLVAAALAADIEPSKAEKLVGEPAKADGRTAMIGLCLAAEAGDSDQAATWLNRAKQARFGAPDGKLGQRQVAEYYLLCAVASRSDADLQAAKKSFASIAGPSRHAAVELAGFYATNKTAASAEARKLILSQVALGVLQTDLSWKWAMQILRARPRSQWAAKLLASVSTPAQQEQIVALLRPEDCYLARLIRARALTAKGQLEEASKVYDVLRHEEKSEALLLAVDQARVEEDLGNLEKALSLYNEFRNKIKLSAISNNTAYILARLYPDNEKRLAEAQELSKEALDDSPRQPAYQETAGWIAHLQGRHEDALRLLRQAVKAMPGEAVAHYHLGMAEKAAGNEQMARRHLARTVTIADELLIANPGLKSPAIRAGEEARKALVAFKP